MHDRNYLGKTTQKFGRNPKCEFDPIKKEFKINEKELKNNWKRVGKKWNKGGSLNNTA